MLLLASNSPRRNLLLTLGGWDFSVLPAEIDEQPFPGEDPRHYVLRLAQDKARHVAARAPQESVVVAADTTVVDGDELKGEILGKPAGPDEAESMLSRLRGRTHLVHTALAVLRVVDGSLLADLCTTRVKMRDYNNEEMLAYIATGDPLDKAGAYAIQHTDFNPVEALEGCFTNVVGLPLCRVTHMLKALGLSPARNVPFACLYTLQDNCSISPQVLDEKFQTKR